MIEDFRSDRMESPEGRGLARRAWDAYASSVSKVIEPAVTPFARKVATKQINDLFGFWLLWHICGGFEGLVERAGMHPSTVWRKVKRFRMVFGQHPDEFEMPGVELKVEDYWAWVARKNVEARGEKSRT